jgi:hypothetical protein
MKKSYLTPQIDWDIDNGLNLNIPIWVWNCPWIFFLNILHLNHVYVFKYFSHF